MRRMLALPVILVLVACGKGERTADSATTTGSPAQVAATQRTPGPGELGKPLAEYTPEEFFQLTQSLQYAGASERDRRCTGPGCTGAAARPTRLRVEGVVGEDSVDLGNVPRFGVIVSRGRNLGANPDAMYGMRPGARYSYFLVILPPEAAGGTARYQIQELDASGNTRSHRMVRTGTARGCGHPFRRGPGADFRTCADTSIFRPASLAPAPLQGIDPPWWFLCEDGCCTTNGPQIG